MEKIVKHDGDGKLYYADNNGIPKWLMEVEIYEADMVENAINRLFEDRAEANVGTSEKDLRVCEVIAGAWISVKEQMPPKNEDVLVLKKNGIKTIMCYFGIDGDFQIRWFSFGKWLDQTSQITHWCHLPK